MRLQAALATRHVAPDAAARIAGALRGRINRAVVTTTSDSESIAFANDIASILAAAGATVDKKLVGVMSPTPYGLFLSLPAGDGVLASALTGEGIAAVVLSSPSEVPQVFVGQKPPQF